MPSPSGPWVVPGVTPQKYTLQSTAEANSAISWTSGCGSVNSDLRLMTNGPNQLLLEDDK